MEHFVASENDGKRENFLSYWCYEGILATCTDAFELNFCLQWSPGINIVINPSFIHPSFIHSQSSLSCFHLSFICK